MAEKADETIVRYHRRLDRTPEKHFERLPNEEKKLISTMRGALENCRNKVAEMKDDIAEKEKTIEEEVTRRKEAEKRLRQYLVDPYSSPEVNSELRNRLPRASKTDPLLDPKEAMESNEDSEADEQVITKSRASRKSAESSRSPREGKHSKKTVRRVLNFEEQPSKSPRQSKPDHDTDTEDSQSDLEDDDVHQHRKSRSRHHRGRAKSQSPPPLHHSANSVFAPFSYSHYPPGAAGFPVSHHTFPMYSPYSLTPWSSVSSVGIAPPGYGPREGQATASRPGIPQSRSYPLLNREQVDGSLGGDAGVPEGTRNKMPPPARADIHTASASNHSTMPAHTFLPAPAAAHDANCPPVGIESQTPTAQKSAVSPEHNPAAPKSELFSQSASSMASSHYALPSSLPKESGLQGIGEKYRMLFPHSGAGVHSVPLLNGRGPLGDLSAPQQTSPLQEEIGRLRTANQELTEKLALCTREVETLKLQILTETPKDGTLDAEAACKLADLMSAVRAGEKRRDEAMVARLRQAEEDREELIVDLEHVLRSKTSTEKQSGHGFAMKDLSAASDTEDSSEEEVELEDVTDMKGVHSTPSARANPDVGRVTSLKDALKELERRQETERHLYQEEMQVVMEQRDQALEQLQVEREKTQLQQLRMRTQREQMLMAKITALQREKDRAENTVLQLKDQLMDRNLYISLHKALFTDNATNDFDKMNPADGKLKKKTEDEDDSDHIDDEGPTKMKEDNQLLEQLRQANQERSLLKMRCEELEAVCKQEKDERNRLERLNGVLRRKLIAVSSSGSHDSQEE